MKELWAPGCTPLRGKEKKGSREARRGDSGVRRKQEEERELRLSKKARGVGGEEEKERARMSGVERERIRDPIVHAEVGRSRFARSSCPFNPCLYPEVHSSFYMEKLRDKGTVSD